MNTIVSTSSRMIRFAKSFRPLQVRSVHSVTAGKSGFEVSDEAGKEKKVGAQQLRLKMLASTLSFEDVVGKVPGSSGVGVVEEVGSKVSDIKAGDRVAVVHSGTWTRSAVVDASAASQVPADLAAEDIASVIYEASRALDITSGLSSTDVLVHNYANGPSGLPLIQAAKQKGAKVISVLTNAVDYASIAKKLKAAGSDVVVDEGFVDSETFKSVLSETPATMLVLSKAGASTEAINTLSSASAKGCKTIDLETARSELNPEVVSLLKDGKIFQEKSVVSFDEFVSALPVVESMSVNGSLVLKM
mmetsp:Transcript_18468/g.21330  ORF Transcript_18468/g.21330 Transcript_18468/m.21330 type:complete len:303 (+) Transcript_18468:197-1105(+)